MARLVVLGLRGESGYWLVDLDAGSVTAMPEGTTEPFGFSQKARGQGASLVAGIDLAVAVTDQDEAFAGRFDAQPFAGRFDT